MKFGAKKYKWNSYYEVIELQKKEKKIWNHALSPQLKHNDRSITEVTERLCRSGESSTKMMQNYASLKPQVKS